MSIAMNMTISDSAGAGRGNRTPMTSRSRDFESRASTNSAIPASCPGKRGIITEIAWRSNSRKELQQA